MKKINAINRFWLANLFFLLAGCDGTLPANYPSKEKQFVASPCPDLSGRYEVPVNSSRKLPILVLPVDDENLAKRLQFDNVKNPGASVATQWDKAVMNVFKLNDYQYKVKLYFSNGLFVGEYISTIPQEARCHDHMYHWGSNAGLTGHSVEGATSHYDDFSRKLFINDENNLIGISVSRTRQVGFGVIVGPIVEDEKRTVYKRLSRQP